MAEILGVVSGLLGPAIEIGKFIYRPIKRQITYLCCFNNNVESLRDESQKLEEKRAGLQMRVDTEENNAQVILPEVKAWIRDVTSAQENITETEKEITNTRNNGSTLKTRYSLSKKVKKTALAIKELGEKCHFDIISQPPPPAALVAVTSGPYSVFESRKDIEEGVMASLKDNEAYIVGICGMGGVGKTTMAKRIMQRVRQECLFEEISMVVISQKVCQEAFQEAEMLRIQDDVAQSLGKDLPKGSVSSRAHDLRTRLTAGTKGRLVVLDDIWGNLNLNDLGIPCNTRCKILLTSRNSDVLNLMNVEKEKVHAVKILTKTEAWHLFESKVGSCCSHPDVTSIAQQVVAECKGLPIALVTVGAALRNTEGIHVWKDCLDQLESSNPIDLPNVLDGVYKPLRSSYDFLNNERAQALFLMCCLYPEDADIPIEELAIYAMGLHMLRGIKSLEVARNRVYSLVQMLKSRFLLLEGKNKDHVKMHDVVRDVAIFIASEKKLITCDSKTNDCTWISPYIGERIELQAGLTNFPNLCLLWIDCYSRDKELENDSQFFEGMKQLNVLVNLQTLVLDGCGSLKSISFVGELVNLEILICRGCNSIESLPTDIRRLRHLRLLQLSYCYKFKKIERGIISSLKGLEELIVEYHRDMQEVENEWVNELEQLSSLSRLKIRIKDSSFATRQMTLPPNVVRYHIEIGGHWECFDFDESQLCEKKMELALPTNINMGNCIVKYVGSVEEMYLEGGDGASLDFGVAHKIKILVFEKCSTVKKLVSMKTAAIVFPALEVLKLRQLSELKGICDVDGPIASDSLTNLKELTLDDLPALEHLNVVSNFNKLSTIYVRKCGKLKSLFSSLTITRDSSLVQLKRLEIVSCDMMEQVFLSNNEETQIPLVFADLYWLKLSYLPKLTSFSKGIGSIEFPVLDDLQVFMCPLKNFAFTTSTKGDDTIHSFCEHDKVKFGRLRKLKVEGLSGMKSLFSSSTIKSGCFSQLEELEIERCEMMEEVILWKEEENRTDIHIALFPKLKLLALHYLPKLISLSKGIQFNLPAEMRIRNCPLLESCASDDNDGYIHLFCKTHEVEFNSLKTLKIDEYNGMGRYWCPQFPMIDIFSGLSELTIAYFEGIKSLFLSSVAQNLQNMRYLRISSCKEMVRVIEDDECGGETPSIHLFPNLEWLELSRLPKLKSFCEWRCALKFPLLKTLEISDCGVMEKFTSEPLNTPVLKDIKISYRGISLGGNDLNALLQQFRLKREEQEKSQLEDNLIRRKRNANRRGAKLK